MAIVSAFGDVTFRDIALRNAGLYNNAASDADLSRETFLNFIGTDSLDSQHALARISATHDGAAADEKGRFSIAINSGNEGHAPSEAFSIDSTGATLTNSITVGGDLVVSGTATFAGQSLHDGGVDVDGTADISDTLTLSKAIGTGLDVTADAAVGGDLNVTGTATFTAQSVHEAGVDINGAADISDTLTLSKATGVSLDVTADAAVGGDLDVSGTATFTAQSVHNGGVDVNGTADISDTLTLSKATGVALDVTADAAVGGDLDVTGTATFASETVHNGGIQVVGTADISGNVVVSGDLSVSGTTTFLDSQTVNVADKNISLGHVDGTSETDVTADGGGITLQGSTDKTFNWVNATDAWTSSEHIDLASGKSLLMAGTQVLTDSQLTYGTSSFSDVGAVVNGMDVNGDAAVSGNLDVTGATNFTGQTVHDGGIDVNGTADISNTLTLSKATGAGLNVTADAAIGGTLSVSNTLTLPKASGVGLDVTADVAVGGELTVSGAGVFSGQLEASSYGGSGNFDNSTIGSAIRLAQNDAESDINSSIGKGVQIFGFQPNILFVERNQNRHWTMFSDNENRFHVGRVKSSSLVNTADESVSLTYPSDSVDTFIVSDSGILVRGFTDESQQDAEIRLDRDNSLPGARRSVLQWSDRDVPAYDLGQVDFAGDIELNLYLRGSVDNLINSGGVINVNSTSHGLDTGNTVVVSGVEGTTEANGTWVVTVVDADNFTLDTSGFSNAYISGGLWYRTVSGGGYAGNSYRVDSSGVMSFTNQTVHEAGVDVNGTADISDTLTLSKASGIALDVTADAAVGGDLDVSGTATFSSETVHNGGVDVNGTADISDTLTLSKASGVALDVTADAAVGGDLDVSGIATFAVETVHNGGVDVNGTADISDTLTLSKASGVALDVTADAAVGGDLGVSGTATFAVETVHNGGIDVNGNASISGDLVVTGSLSLSGSTTVIDSQTLNVADKNISLGHVDGTSETDVTADGGGITLQGSTDKTFNWVNATDAWTSSENIDLASGKSLLVDGEQVLSSTEIVLDSVGQEGVVYLGNPALDDTWRITVESGNLVFQARVAGSWVDKFSLTK